MKQILFLALFSGFFFNTTIASTPGLNFNYYEGTWNTLPDFNSLTPLKKGIATNVTLDQRNKDNQYAFLWQGFINIPAKGNYTFETNSDDGSRLYIGSYSFTINPLVDNDGIHPSQFVTGTLALNAGVYPISITYFQNYGGQAMEVYWSSDAGISRQKIPDNVLTADDPSLTGLTYSYYEGNWDSLPDFRATTFVKRGTSANISLDDRNRETQFGFLWQGNITIPVAGDYTFETYSDDGSKLYIGSYDYHTQALVDNEGVHYNKSATGTIFLNAGIYPIAIAFFQKLGGQVMEVYWSSNTGIPRQRIPDNAFGGRRSVDPTAPTDGITGSGNNYYFSSSTGDDSRSPSQALDPSTPWKTIDKLNSFMPNLKPGDGLLLKRGDTFDGKIIMSQSGTAGSPIIVSAYGSGNKPVINGLKTLGNWTPAGNGVWEADLYSGNYLNLVLVNNVVTGMGRYPNLSDPNRGYLTYESHADSTQITDDQLNTSIDWIGAELVVRKNDWVLDRGVIRNQSGHTLTFESPTGHESTDQYGYFIQNSPLTLDQTGEWYYNQYVKKLKVYFGSDNPDNYSVKASIADTLLDIYHQDYVTVDNLFFQGANVDGVRVTGSTNVHIQNCDVTCSGHNGINGYLSPYLSIENNSVNHSSNTGIKLDSACFYALIRNNVVRNSGLLPGMGSSNNQQYDGIFSESTPSNVIELNTVDSSGYCGITFTGDLTIVRNNYITNFCFNLDDGGGIYTWGGWDVSGRIVANNVILYGPGAPEGTSSPIATGVVGVYLDDRSSHVEISNNTVGYCSRAGIMLHNAHDVNNFGNTLFNNGIGLSMVHDDLEVNDPIRNVESQNNIVVTTVPHKLLMQNVSSLNDIGSFGSYDQNYYARPMDDQGVFYTNTKVGNEYKSVYYNLPQWTARFGYDQHSFKSPVAIAPFVVNSITGPNKYPNGNFNSNVDGIDVQSSPGVGTASYNSGGKLDGGALQVSFDGSGGATNGVAIYLDLGAVTAGKNYLIKFSLLGAGAGKTINAFILQNGAPWGRLSDITYFEFSSTRSENQFVFTAPSTESDVMICFNMNGPDCPYWMDNFQMNEADISFTNVDDYVRFEYNGTGTAKNVSLSGNYVDVKNTLYQGQVTVPPYSSVILMKQGPANATNQPSSNQVTAAQLADVQTMEATAMTLKLTPNPVVESLQVAVNLPAGTQSASMSVYSLAGVRIKTIPLTTSFNNVGVDVSTLSAGVYLVNINYDGHVITKKFVKQSK